MKKGVPSLLIPPGAEKHHAYLIPSLTLELRRTFLRQFHALLRFKRGEIKQRRRIIDRGALQRTTFQDQGVPMRPIDRLGEASWPVGLGRLAQQKPQLGSDSG